MNQMKSNNELTKAGEEVAKCLFDISAGFAKAAQLVGKAVEKYGLDAVLDEWEGKVPSRIIRKLVLVYEGKLLPYFVQHPELCPIAVRLPREEQQRIVDDQAVRTWTPSGVLMIRPSKMEPAQRRQVFGPHGIRDEGEQRIWIEAQPKKLELEVKEEASVRFDPKKGLIVRGSTVIPPADIMRYAGQIVQKLS